MKSTKKTKLNVKEYDSQTKTLSEVKEVEIPKENIENVVQETVEPKTYKTTLDKVSGSLTTESVSKLINVVLLTEELSNNNTYSVFLQSEGKDLKGLKSYKEIQSESLTLNSNRTKYKIKKPRYELEKNLDGSYIKEDNGEWKYKLDSNGKKIVVEGEFIELNLFDLSDTNYVEKESTKLKKENLTSDTYFNLKIDLSDTFNVDIQEHDLKDTTPSYYDYKKSEIIINDKKSDYEKTQDLLRNFGRSQSLTNNESEIFAVLMNNKIGIEQEKLNISIDNDLEKNKKMIEKSILLYKKVNKKIELENIINLDKSSIEIEKSKDKKQNKDYVKERKELLKNNPTQTKEQKQSQDYSVGMTR